MSKINLNHKEIVGSVTPSRMVPKLVMPQRDTERAWLADVLLPKEEALAVMRQGTSGGGSGTEEGVLTPVKTA